MKENLEEKQLDQELEIAQSNFKGIFKSIKLFLLELLDIRKGTDKDATALTIKEGISMKGHTAWILVFSILVASIGLNVSSTAVVIGAMLISPLMGPILGVGYSIGVNDVDTLRSSLINLGVMVGLSLLTSFAFFSIPIFQDATPELLARTTPDVRDVLIAVSGGLALMVAITRPRPQFNTVAGVAIATALMPPLCTAGYGLAIGNFSYFGGAMFLFTINSIFIALAAYGIIRYLHFPMEKYINSSKRRRISRVASFVALVIISLSIYSFYQLFAINQYKTTANHFINSLKEEGVNVIGDTHESIDYKQKEIKLYIFGSDYTDKDRLRWQKQLEDIGLTDTKLNILQSQDDTRLRDDIDNLKNLYVNSNRLISLKDETIQEKDLKISALENNLRKYQDNEIPFDEISKEIKINYENLENISFAREFVTNFEKIDTVSVISLKWKEGTRSKTKADEQEKLEKWLAIRLRLKNLEVRILP